MTLNTFLIELLNRLGANNGAPIFISAKELNEWPKDFFVAIKSCGLIIQAAPATSIICPGCEQSCSMPVNILHQENTQKGFVFCDKRSDINRVVVPFNYIEQWQTSGYLLAKLISKLLKLPLSNTSAVYSNRWEIGVLRGSKHSSHLVLTVDDNLIIQTSGYNLSLDELLSFTKKTIKIDRQKIVDAVDNPAIGGGDTESASQRKNRLKARADTLKLKGTKGFLKQVAKEEGISIPRLKQIIYK